MSIEAFSDISDMRCCKYVCAPAHRHLRTIDDASSDAGGRHPRDRRGIAFSRVIFGTQVIGIVHEAETLSFMQAKRFEFRILNDDEFGRLGIEVVVPMDRPRRSVYKIARSPVMGVPPISE
jgi:hypothetical protein